MKKGFMLLLLISSLMLFSCLDSDSDSDSDPDPDPIAYDGRYIKGTWDVTMTLSAEEGGGTDKLVYVFTQKGNNGKLIYPD